MLAGVDYILMGAGIPIKIPGVLEAFSRHEVATNPLHVAGGGEHEPVVMVFDPAKVGKNCEFCGSPALVDYQELQSPVRPQSLLPFKLSQSDVRDRMKRWYSGRWFAPNAFKHKSLIDQLHGLYVPYWTFDAQGQCEWQAEGGHYYYSTES